MNNLRPTCEAVPTCVRLFRILAISFLACQLLFATTETGSAASLASAGWRAYEEGRFTEAKTLMQRAVGSSPRQPDYQAALAEIDWKLNDREAAIRHFEEAVRLRPSDSEVRFRLAQLYQSLNKDLDALRILRVAKAQQQLSGAWHFSRGFSLFRMGRFPPAHDEFKLLLQDPQLRAPANFFLGNIAYSQNQLGEAARYLVAAVQQGNSKENKAYNAYTYDYGLVLLKLGRFAEADREFRESIDRYAQDPLPWMFLGRCEQELGNYQAAIDALEHSIRLDPNFQLSYYELARLQQRHGDKLRAEALFQKISQMKMEEIKQEEDRAMKLRTGIPTTLASPGSGNK